MHPSALMSENDPSTRGACGHKVCSQKVLGHMRQMTESKYGRGPPGSTLKGKTPIPPMDIQPLSLTSL